MLKVWEVSVNSTIKRKEENYMELSYGLDCEPWEGHHWILGKPKEKWKLGTKNN